MLNGTQTGQISQDKRMKPIAAYQVMDGSELFTPIRT
jgi:hypothetical protein